LVHTAAASNLGQMLNRICAQDGVPLVNIVRKAEQAELLRNLGAQHVCNTESPSFMEDLTAALVTTGATLDEASLVLREAGALGVSVWVLARTPPPGWR